MPSAIQPDIYDEDQLDEIRTVTTEQGWEMSERLAEQEGIAAGYSSGANVYKAIEVAEELDQGVVVTIVCDHADRYFGE